ncbi:hypothetical protein A3C23_03620 [Candidatus Roizmanbacteria bacterium RIFCSPHIGHO2_02_FULL_37_13b]|uniref:Mannosyl-glycoprotein endo-beta-N-acetylglucosamidase-like domain-containing protein n=1 Tax=Candidatus Roizmanbacteria bacterium RIFCSPLOWO2_02_FULL_36_11 TaxID=1802071 RepID=A0A1F7JBY4_9BACT|nr:MAG: hypothetical protein A3C23_03620 [Candidatus Roizmanbacteria bacterium RIFCSPHIGHO2_02_FULL_37_13b]OGK53126.1 MAG: hypothetical protein A3H78_01955 [Candidatus Roizmanbacteria bacterium RIFCSPLOWO2_02_FULL_36_11]
MTKKIISIIFLVALFHCTSSGISAVEMIHTGSASLKSALNQSREYYIQKKAMENVLAKNNSILKLYTHDYLTASYAYNIDPYLLVSISGLESSFGKRMKENTFNAYGWGGGHLSFESWPHGIFTISRSLRFKYYDRGAETISDIGRKYAASPTWAARVNKFIAKFYQEENRLKRLSYLL